MNQFGVDRFFVFYCLSVEAITVFFAIFFCFFNHSSLSLLSPWPLLGIFAAVRGVCVCVHMYIYTQLHIYICIYTHIYVHVYI